MRLRHNKQNSKFMKMRALGFLFFLKFITYIEAIKSKSVNLALETVLEFNHKDNAADVKFLDNVQEFLDKVKTVIGTNRTSRRFDYENKNIKFTDFVKTAIDILKTYDNDDLEDVFAVFDDEIRKYHYRGCKFYELVEDQNVRRFVANKLDAVKDKPADKLRNNLDNAIQAIEYSKFSGIRTEFLDYVNSLYRQDSSDKLKAFLNNLQTYSSKSKRANLDLIKVVRDGIRSIIFDHYSALNANARKDLKIKLETSWRSVKYPERVERNIWTIKYTSKNLKTTKYNKISDQTDDIDPEVTTRASKLRSPNTESDISTELSDYREMPTTSNHKHKSSHKKYRDFKGVYFNKDKYKKLYGDDKGYNRDSTSRPHKVISPKTVNSSSDLSDIEEDTSTTHQYKLKSRPKKHKDKTFKVTKPKYVTPKKHRHSHKRLSSFITLYPEEITFNTKKLRKESTTRKAKLYTLWEEKLKQKKRKDIDRKSSKTKTNLRTKADSKVIAESDTIINVKRAVASAEEDSSHKHKKRDKINRESKPTTKNHTKTKSTESKYTLTTRMKFRKNIPKATTLEEGISIESYEIQRRSMTEKNNDTSVQAELKRNVLRRINNLEKQMEEVKNKIDTKITTDVNTMLTDTSFEPLEFWKSTAAADINNNNRSISNSTLSKKTVIHNVTRFETTEINAMQHDSNKTKHVDESTKTDNITIKEEGRTIDKEINKNISSLKENKNVLASLADANNEIGKGLSEDGLIDKIVEKYNISVKPDATEKPFDFDKFSEESERPGEGKKEKVKNIIENDLKKILEEKTKPNDVNEFNDPFQDFNTALDFLRH